VGLVGEGIVFRAQLLRPLDLAVDIVAIAEELASGLIHEHAIVDIAGKGIGVVANANVRGSLAQGKSRAAHRQTWIDYKQADPRSVLLVVQTGRNAAAQLGKIERLDDLLDSILTSPRDQVAVLTFDSRPHVIQDFTVSSDAISHSLASIRPGDTGAALFDALHTAVAMFDKAPAESRRIILLISGEHDHGSIAPSAALLIQSISLADISVYGLTFTAPRKELLARMWSMNPLAMTSNAMQRNAAEALAQLTGGDFYHFDSERSFEERVGDVANHIHNSYFLTFQPHDPVPGFHSLQVSVLRSKTDVVAARSGYWFSATDDANSEACIYEA
jgi:VWFA-related protein